MANCVTSSTTPASPVAAAIASIGWNSSYSRSEQGENPRRILRRHVNFVDFEGTSQGRQEAVISDVLGSRVVQPEYGPGGPPRSETSLSWMPRILEPPLRRHCSRAVTSYRVGRQPSAVSLCTQYGLPVTIACKEHSFSFAGAFRLQVLSSVKSRVGRATNA